MGTGLGQAFSDESTPPRPASIAAALGDAAPVWPQTVAAFEAAGVTMEWRYYRDGGWLAKVTDRRRTIAWMRVEPGLLRVTFYFPERLRETLLAEPTLRAQIPDSTGRTIAVSLELGAASTPERLAAALALKLRTK